MKDFNETCYKYLPRVSVKRGKVAKDQGIQALYRCSQLINHSIGCIFRNIGRRAVSISWPDL